jgi:beta-lactamase regulating signal transducer with metallopeptidase domain
VTAFIVGWLASALVNGTLFAALAWLASATWLRSASGRLLCAVWFVALVQFVWWRPIAWPSQQLPAAILLDLPPTASGLAPAPWLLAYLAIVGCAWARLVWRHQRLRRTLLQLEAAEPSVLHCVRSAAQALGLRAIPEVRVSDERVAPYSVGPLGPILIVPRFLCEPGPRLHAILLHELAHIARRDHFMLWFERAVRSVFFFWPPVHFVANKLGEARELACDEQAITRAGLCPVDYARLLVDVVALTRAPRRTEVLAMGHGALRLERRVDRLLADHRPMRLRAVQHAALVLLMAATFVGIRVETLRAASVQAQIALPACDGSAMSYAPSGADCAGGDCVLQCGP